MSGRVGNSQSWREVLDPTVSRAVSYDVRASWRLDRLVFDPNEPRFTAFDISRRRARRRIVALVTHLYQAWLDATVEVGGGDDLDGAPDTDLALIQGRRARAELDALTDGWFSDALANSARSR